MSFNIEFDYRFDSTGFFDDAERRASLEQAAAIWEAIILDEFDDLPVGTRFTVDDPSNAGVDREVVLTDPIDDLLIFVGAENLTGPLGLGGFDGTDVEGDVVRRRTSSNFRDQGPTTDFEPWVGTVTYDIDGVFSFAADGPVAGQNDFLTITLHEIGHVLGLGTAAIFDAIGEGGIFDGPNALAVTEGAGIPLESDLSHVEEGFDGNAVNIDPIITTGSRVLPSDIDKALLADIGYEIAGTTKQGSLFAVTTEGADVTVFGTILGDDIDGLGGDDQIQGNAGNDTLQGGSGDDTVFGGAGDDLLDGGADSNFVSGGEGADTLVGGGGASTLNGDAGIDVFRVSGGGGVMTVQDFDLALETIELATPGFDSPDAAVAGITKPFTNVSELTFADGTVLRVFHDSQTGTPLTARNFTLPAVPPEEPTTGDDDLIGTDGADFVDLLAGDDRYTAGEGADSVFAGEGDDVVFGEGGDDTINGWSGDDTLDGGIGADLLIGGQGSDVFYVDNAADRVSESRKWTGTDTVISSVDFRTGNRHIENVELTGDARIGAGNGLRNVITGNDGGNILDGGKNVDTLIGGLGDDRYLIRAPGDNAVEAADGGNDTVLAFRAYALDAHVENLFLQTLRNAAGEGVAGVNGIGNGIANTIIGNPFDNFITGREGSDTLKGQAGADTFVFDRALGADNIDRIIDFNTNEAAEGDRILLKQSIFAGVVKGELSALAFVAGTAAADAEDRLIFDRASGQLWFDSDGTGGLAQQLIATFEQNAQVTAADIEIF